MPPWLRGGSTLPGGVQPAQAALSKLSLADTVRLFLKEAAHDPAVCLMDVLGHGHWSSTDRGRCGREGAGVIDWRNLAITPPGYKTQRARPRSRPT